MHLSLIFILLLVFYFVVISFYIFHWNVATKHHLSRCFFTAMLHQYHSSSKINNMLYQSPLFFSWPPPSSFLFNIFLYFSNLCFYFLLDVFVGWCFNEWYRSEVRTRFFSDFYSESSQPVWNPPERLVTRKAQTRTNRRRKYSLNGSIYTNCGLGWVELLDPNPSDVHL